MDQFCLLHEAYNNHQIYEIKNRTTQCVALLSLVTVGLFCISPELVKIMAASSYWESIRIIAPAILGVYFTFLYGFPVEIEYFFKKTHYIAIGTVVSAVLNVILCILLVPRYGYETAVYVTLFTYILYFLAHMAISYAITNRALPFDMKTMFLYILAVCISCVIIQLTLNYMLLRYLVALLWLVFLYCRYQDIAKTYLFKFFGK